MVTAVRVEKSLKKVGQTGEVNESESESENKWKCPICYKSIKHRHYHLDEHHIDKVNDGNRKKLINDFMLVKVKKIRSMDNVAMVCPVSGCPSVLNLKIR